jgi:hypothetical protein
MRLPAWYQSALEDRDRFLEHESDLLHELEASAHRETGPAEPVPTRTGLMQAFALGLFLWLLIAIALLLPGGNYP